MIKNLFYKLKGLFKVSEKENIKEVLEDLIEEIVGDISDEFDYEGLEYSKIDNNVYLFNAKISLNDFYRVSKILSIESFEKRRGEAETLGGFLTEITQRLPRIREKISFTYIKAMNDKNTKIGPNNIIVFKDLNNGVINVCVITIDVEYIPKEMLT